MTQAKLIQTIKTSHNRGFTLIELLIALTILGILMTMAVPVYFDHQTKAQLSEAITLGGAHRVNVEDHILNHGNFPSNEYVNQLVPWMEEVDGEMMNRYPNVQQVELVPDGAIPNAGSIRITLLESAQISNALRGQTVEFRRTESGSWYCFSSVQEELLPRGCQQR